METKAMENGQAKVNPVKADKTPKFVAGNPVNSVSKKAEEEKPKEKAGEESVKPAEAVSPEASKVEIKEHLKQQKPALNLDETLKLIADLAKKTALRDRYKDTIDGLKEFEDLQKSEIDELEDETAFQQCELIITHSKGFRFSLKSPAVIKGIVAFMSRRLEERMAEVEASIVLPS